MLLTFLFTHHPHLGNRWGDEWVSCNGLAGGHTEMPDSDQDKFILKIFISHTSSWLNIKVCIQHRTRASINNSFFKKVIIKGISNQDKEKQALLM